ncbi:MAG: hypothetical protein AAF501_16495, partial [Pseudomonadota bacterium]
MCLIGKGNIVDIAPFSAKKTRIFKPGGRLAKTEFHEAPLENRRLKPYLRPGRRQAQDPKIENCIGSDNILSWLQGSDFVYKILLACRRANQGCSELFKDDQMLPMLTGVVIMLAIGIFAQRSESVMSLFSSDDDVRDQPSFALNDDTVQASTAGFTRIDVLANDEGLEIEEYRDLIIDSPPSCGDVMISGGAIQYRPTRECGAFQSFSYRLSRRDERESGIVRVQIGKQDAVELARAPDEPAPQPAPQAVGEPATPGAVSEQQPSAIAGLTAAAPLTKTPEPQPQAVDAAKEQPKAAETPLDAVKYPAVEITVAMALPDAPLDLEPRDAPASPDPEVATAVTAPDVVEEAARDLDPLATRGLVPGSPDEPASSDT